MNKRISEYFLDKRYLSLGIIIIFIFACCNFYCITQLSITSDESTYYRYAANVLKLQPQKQVLNGKAAFDSQMPIVVINTLPRVIEQLLKPGLKHDQFQTLIDVNRGRIFSIFCALLLAWYVLLWSTKLYGQKAGIFSLLLYSLCPNILANSQMVSTDVYSFLLCTATLYHTWYYCKSRQIKQLLIVSILLGLGQISKQSLLLLYPIVLILLLVNWYTLKIKPINILKGFLKEILIISLLSILIINVGFLFYKTGKTLSQYHFYSSKFINYQKQLLFLAKVPIPFPEPYVAGFDIVALSIETPPGITGLSSYGATSFLGNKITGKRIILYYTISCLYKLSISFMLFLLTTLILYFRHFNKASLIKNELYLLFPAAFIFISFSLLNTMYLGIRNIFFLFPLLFIFCGYLINYYSESDRKPIKYIIIGSLLLYQLISVSIYFPHFLPYTNEFIINKKNVYKYLGDSNIYDWEGRKIAKEYLSKHLEVQYEPSQFVHGKVMVSLENYLDFWFKGKVQWLINLKLEPVDHLDSQYLIFDIP